MFCLQYDTPTEWASLALEDIPALLADHLSCEFKAAQAARAIQNKWGDRYPALVPAMTALTAEESVHYQMVEKMQAELGVAPPPGRQEYTSQMRKLAGQNGGSPLDLVLVSGLIEARSCERFKLLTAAATGGLKSFYEDFLAAEARHYALFVDLARDCFGGRATETRLDHLARAEADICARMPLVPRVH